MDGLRRSDQPARHGPHDPFGALPAHPPLLGAVARAAIFATTRINARDAQSLAPLLHRLGFGAPDPALPLRARSSCCTSSALRPSRGTPTQRCSATTIQSPRVGGCMRAGPNADAAATPSCLGVLCSAASDAAQSWHTLDCADESGHTARTHKIGPTSEMRLIRTEPGSWSDCACREACA